MKFSGHAKDLLVGRIASQLAGAEPFNINDVVGLVGAEHLVRVRRAFSRRILARRCGSRGRCRCGRLPVQIHRLRRIGRIRGKPWRRNRRRRDAGAEDDGRGGGKERFGHAHDTWIGRKCIRFRTTRQSDALREWRVCEPWTPGNVSQTRGNRRAASGPTGSDKFPP